MTSHKPHPSMPYWYWLGTDGCWFCKNKNNCNNCGIIKKDIKEKARHRKYKNCEKGI